MFWDGYINGTLPMMGSFGYDTFQLDAFWPQMHQTLRHLYGRPILSERGSSYDTNGDLMNHLGSCKTEEFFDFMEAAFKLRVSWRLMSHSDQIVDSINEMFRIEGLPYDLTHWVTREEPSTGFIVPGVPASGTQIVTTALPQVIRTDDEIIHQEAVRPALVALAAPHFAQANQDFLNALRHYRDGDFPECLTACGTTMESTLKVLCDRNKWSYNQTNALKALLDIVIRNTMLDPFFHQPLMLIGTMRNRLSSAHGRGAAGQHVPQRIARYAIASTAAAVVLLIEEADR